MQWITANAAVNPITKKDIDSGVYNAMDIEVPINANPYGDLVTEYWLSVRQVVRESITSAAAKESTRVVEDTSSPVRLRPILMTSLTIILAMLPAVFGAGAGADVNAPMAVAVIGGMISSTLLSLVVVPAVYSLVESALEKRKAEHSPGSNAVK